jgi:hypothetical protein
MTFLIRSPKYGKHEVIIDDEDWEKVKQLKWCVDYGSHNGEKYLSHIRAFCGYKNGKEKKVCLNRFLLNVSDYDVVDYIDGNVLDNRKINLRMCSPRENARNVKKHRNNKGEYKGVTRRLLKNSSYSYLASIYVNEKQTFLGSFLTAEAAALAYNQAAQKYYGEFARLNVL